MTRGYVAGQQARIGVVFLLADPSSIELEFVIDTGFEGALTLPSEAVAALGLPFDQELIANRADASNIRVDVYRARILWNGDVRTVAVLATGKRPLLGTSLLVGYEINIPFADGRTVTIEPL